MKKVIYTLALLSIAFASCRKEQASSPVQVQPKLENGYYPLGTVIPLSPTPVQLERGNHDLSYIPEYTWAPGGHQQFAKGTFGSGDEVARSVNGYYSLFIQADGNLVLYKRSTPNGSLIPTALWATDTSHSYPSAKFSDTNGIISLLAPSTSGPVNYWVSNVSSGSTDAIWVLQDDGNFVGYTHYYLGAGAIVITGAPFAATFTDGGRRSDVFGRVGRV
ncbi:hypothetical protein [Pedobacter duraquae]|uniref:Bulb-type lectin domain-containing protein n=1 Tax=Pedobacter duraquae TaxID=425511 RepID=A0A4V3C2T8_9SPHI|nr:hypothetical protein [Pedobacter duraquae]TDO19639.1 hypothetical protein CLV32_4262 [Pedobacter duraquae]